MISFFKKNGKYFSEWATFLGVIIAIISLLFIYFQLSQNNYHKKWQNYNELNIRYSQLYKNMPDEIEKHTKKEFSELESKSKKWVRQYLILCSEEYWLYLNNLIPEEMWTKRIKNGVKINFRTYPNIIKGYSYWNKKGAFKHPEKFRYEIEKIISECCKIKPNKAFHADPKSYAPFVALRYNATKTTKLFGLVN